MRFALWLLIACTVAVETPAFACPPGPCLKYRRMRPPPPVQSPVTTYVLAGRPRRPPLRASTRQIQRFLDGSTWSELAPSQSLRTLELVSAARIRRDQRIWQANYLRVLLRQIERRRGAVYVAVDDAFYQLVACRTGANRGTSCLVRVDELPPEPDARFATPPP